MPKLGSPVYTALDVQAQLIQYLSDDAFVSGAIVNAKGQPSPILDDDPSPGSIDQTTNMRLVVTLAGEGEIDAELGGLEGGAADVSMTFGILLYIYEGENRDSANKRKLVQATSIVRQALMRYRQGAGVPDGSSVLQQLWWVSAFRKLGNEVTTYYTPKNCRLSVTMIEVTSRVQYT